MLNDLRTTNTGLNIEIMGVNSQSDAIYNPTFLSEGRSLPWLQDTAEQDVWNRWKVTWRDVRILDSQNRLVSVYNLTTYDLADPTNVLALKQLLLAAARVVDSDGDGLPDDWETQYFGDLAAGPDQDFDRDGVSNYLEYAFGTDPTDPKVSTEVTPTRIRSSKLGSVAFSYRRRAGLILDYVIEMSTNLQQWTPVDPLKISVQAPRNQFDGTGTSEVVFSPTAAGLSDARRYFRVRTTAR